MNVVERQDAPPRLVTVYHLVDRRPLRAWRAVVARVLPSLARQGIVVTVSGPWPPYAFAEIT